MKREEEIVRLFLVGTFGTEPIYEPLGKSTPPDFAIGKTAFEVRRLNQGFVDESGNVQGLEEVDYRLRRALKMELDKIPVLPEQDSFHLTADFERPLRQVGEIAREIAGEARLHYSAGLRKTVTFRVGGVSVTLRAATNSHEKACVSVSASDLNTAGMVRVIYTEAIQNALNDKIVKTKDIVNRFDKWILVLVDRVLPEISWVNDLGILTLDLQHFSTIIVIDESQTLILEWPENSLHAGTK